MREGALMIRNSLKKAVSVLLTGAVMFGFAGCLDFGGNKKAVIEAADTLASNMASADAAKLIKNSTLSKKSDEAVALTELLSNDKSSEDEAAFYKAVEKTIEYEIDEDSVTVEKDSASINIVFTIADYSKVLQDDFSSIDELTAAIKKADTMTVKFTAEFAKEEKEWIPDNVGSKKFMKLYEYRNAEIVLGLSADIIKGFIDKSLSGFWLSEDKYLDTTFIEYDLYLDSAIYDYESRNEYMYIVLSKDGIPVYTGPDIKIGESTYVVLRVDSDQAGLGAFEYFETGKYTMDLYYKGPNGDELIESNSVDVEKTVIPTINSSSNIGPTDDLFPGEGEYFDFNDRDFRSNVIVAKWFDYDGYKLDDDVYSSDVLTIAFSLEVVPSCTMEVEYCYYYTDSEDEDALSEALTNPIYSDTVTPTTYANGTFYDFDYEVNGEADPGYYVIVVFEAGTSNVLLYGFCVVS
jgi:hypothetical protein